MQVYYVILLLKITQLGRLCYINHLKLFGYESINVRRISNFLQDDSFVIELHKV